MPGRPWRAQRVFFASFGRHFWARGFRAAARAGSCGLDAWRRGGRLRTGAVACGALASVACAARRFCAVWAPLLGPRGTRRVVGARCLLICLYAVSREDEDV